MRTYTQKEVSDAIHDKIEKEKDILIESYNLSKCKIGYFFIDDLLPVELATNCYKVFPDKVEMRRLKSIREYKYVSAQMDKHNEFLETVLYAFQDAKVVNLISNICGINSLHSDKSLYAGGLSLMAKSNFLNPHLDNSHDAGRQRWRVLNLLYYVTPNWEVQNGGHLELWLDGPKNKPIQIESRFNRLVVMATHDESWHSVNKIVLEKNRCCISNYYFSDTALKEKAEFHVTKYRGRPEEPFKNIILGLDAHLRMFIRKFFRNGIRKNPHIYRKNY